MLPSFFLFVEFQYIPTREIISVGNFICCFCMKNVRPCEFLNSLEQDFLVKVLAPTGFFVVLLKVVLLFRYLAS